jgi:hypothetical protein
MWHEHSASSREEQRDLNLMKRHPLITLGGLAGAALAFACLPTPAQPLEFRLAQPRDGEQFLAGDIIALRAEANDDTAQPWHVLFLDGNQVIAEDPAGSPQRFYRLTPEPLGLSEP